MKKPPREGEGRKLVLKQLGVSTENAKALSHAIEQGDWEGAAAIAEKAGLNLNSLPWWLSATYKDSGSDAEVLKGVFLKIADRMKVAAELVEGYERRKWQSTAGRMQKEGVTLEMLERWLSLRNVSLSQDFAKLFRERRQEEAKRFIAKWRRQEEQKAQKNSKPQGRKRS